MERARAWFAVAAIAALAVVGALLAAGPAQAQEPGTLTVTVFRDGSLLPWEGAELFLVGAQTLALQTDDLGTVEAELPAGAWTISVSGGPPSAPIVVAPSELSEALLTVAPDGRIVRALIEAPEPSEPASTPHPTPDAEPGRVVARVVESEREGPLAEARVFVRGSDAEPSTDGDGRFLLDLPAGSWRITIVRSGFSTGRVDVVVEAGEVTSLTIPLDPATPELDDFVVLAPRVSGSTSALLDERKESTSVSDVLGAEQMAASGDQSAAGALKRVSGLTVVGGKYVYVRGLGERYSSTLLNGANLPSPEPERRVVPLDLFPTRMLDSVVIQKTFSPDMPAEFGGGVVRLRTRSVPEGPVLSLNVSGGLQTGGTFTPGLRSQGGPTDFLGIDGGYRKLPGLVADASAQEALSPGDRFSDRGYTAQELEAFGEAMPNRYATERKTIPPDFGLGATFGHGERWEDGRKAGFLLGLNWSQAWDAREEQRLYYLPALGELEESHKYSFERLQRGVGLGGILAAGFAPHADHEFDSTTIVTRKSDDETRIYGGYNRDAGQDIEVTRLRWVARMLITQQLRGSHTIAPLAGFGIDWRFTGSWAFRDEPDRREYRYDLEPESDDVWTLSDRPEGNQRFYSELRDAGYDLGVDLSQPFPVWLGGQAKVKVGGMFVTKSRAVDTRRFKFFSRGALATDLADTLPPQEAFVPEYIGADGFVFEEFTRETDNYTASQSIGAVYGMVELPLFTRLDFMGGVRLERSAQNVSTFALFNPDAEPVQAELVTLDVLPAATLTLRLLRDESMAVRGGYGMTVSRPDFRELSPATFNDVTGGRQTFGNPDLQRARIHNADLRWEWYPTPSESLSVGAFYKRFEQPIETTVVVSAQLSVTWNNALSADNVGVELDWRKNFGFIAPPLQDLVFSGNVSLIHSRIRLDPDGGTNTSDKRAMQGQSPFVVNVGLGYDNPTSGTRVSVLYNVFGRRIDEVGALGSPDTYEEPFHQLDLVASQQLPGGFRLGVKGKNLINGKARWTTGGQPARVFRRGAEVGVSLSWDGTVLGARAKP